MKRNIGLVLACGLALFLATEAWAQSVEIRMTNGSRWRGEIAELILVRYRDQGVALELEGRLRKVTDMYIQVEGELAGRVVSKTIFRSDIVGIESKGAAEETPKAKSSDRGMSGRRPDRGAAKKPAAGDGRGVFVLPLEGPVGEDFRVDEIRKIGEHADEFGPGQIIILKIKSNGGLVLEAELITEAIRDIKRRHRVIAWVDKAISAGCSTAMACNEIYFMTTGSAGSVTTVSGTQSLPEEAVRDHIENLVEIAKESGYSEHIARAMKLNHYMCSYDKDPETGEITWYGDLSGEHVLSDDQSNLCFNATNALDCGFSKGTADTPEDLAALLDLSEWREVDDYGRQIAEDWKRTAETAKEDIRRSLARLNYYKSGSGSAEEVLGSRIQILKKLIQWWDRAPNIARMMLPEKWQLERELEELKKQMADMRRNRR